MSRARSRRLGGQDGSLLAPIALMLGVVAVLASLLVIEGVIDARRVISQGDADAAFYVARAGLEHAAWQTGESRCSGDLTVASTSFGSDSYSASVIAGGLTGTASLPADRDAWIRSDDVTKNNGSNADMHLRLEGANIEQALFRFDLSAVPAGAQINAATAWFYVRSNGEHPEGPLTVHRITADWTELGVTWDSFGASFDAEVLATIPAQPTAGVWVEVNLTSQVQAWVNGAEPNFGVLLAPTTDGTHGHYVSREGAAGEQPRLDLVVSASGVPASPAQIQATGTLANGVTRTLRRAAAPAYGPPAFFHGNLGQMFDDTYVFAFKSTTNYGTDATVEIDNVGSTRYALFDFELSIPAGARIASAELALNFEYVEGTAADAEISAHRMLEPWTEHGATWNESNGSTSWTWPDNHDVASPVDTVPFDSPGPGWYTWDLTSLVQDWADGRVPDHGVVLAASGGLNNIHFTSSDTADPMLWPRFTVTYACECDMACLTPQGSGDMLMVVSDFFNPHPTDVFKYELFESWGYDVDHIDDDADPFLFGLGMAGKEVIYVSGSASDASLGGKVSGAPIGIVSELGAHYDELGIASSSAVPIGSVVSVSDAAHYITGIFPPGDLPIYEASMRGLVVAGTPAPTLRSLVRWGGMAGPGGLVVLDEGALTTGGGAAPARRVGLPIGGASLDPRFVTANGWLLVQRAIHWAAGAGTGSASVQTLWLSTLDDVTGSGAPGLDAWTDGEVLELGDPNLELEPSTNGTFSSVLDLDALGDGDVDIDAIHYVDTDITVGGANSVDLLPGDVLLSTADNETLTSLDTLSVNDEDVFVFRPALPGDYSSGSFIFLLDGSQIHGESDTVGISLVEKTTSVGNGSLTAGSFIVAVTNRRDVIEFTATDVGIGTTTGGFTEFIDGPSLSLGSEIRGMDLAEDAVAIGGHVIPAGAILLTLNNDDTGGVGDNLVPADSADVFYLTVATVGASPVADATLLFEGADVSLDTSGEHLQALSLTHAVTAAVGGGGGGGGGGPPEVLFVAPDPASLSPNEQAKKTAIESWGYAVNLIDVDDPPSDFDAAVATNDVVFIAEEIDSNALGTKLVGATIGVVTEEVNLSDEFGLADGVVWGSGTFLKVLGPAHYITEPFAAGGLIVLNSTQSLAAVAPALAPELDLAGVTEDGWALVTVEAGADLLAGRTAAGRRVQLPWGGTGMPLGALNADGLTIMRRALEWGAGLTPAEPILLSTESSAELGGMIFDDEDVAEYDPDADTATRRFDGSTVGLASDVDALHVLENDHVLLSMIGSGTLGGQAFENEDLIDYDPVADTGTLAFDGSALFTSGSTDISAVHVMANGNLLFTNEYSATLGGLAFESNDIVEYDPVADSATLFLDGDAVGLGAWIDAVHLLGDGDIVLSIAGSGTLGGLSFGAGDLARYDPAADTATLYFDGNLFTASEHVRSVHVGAGTGTAPSALGGGGSTSYVETHSPWSATSADTWQSFDLGTLGVPGNAVAEVAVLNDRTDSQRWGGVRAAGSTLDRRFQLHEAESGGVDAVVMHVQADASARIEHYSDDTGDVSFVLLGYWTGVSYVEKFQVFKAGASTSWRSHGLGSYGVAAGEVAEIVAVNKRTDREREAGVRSIGFGGERRLDIHEAESGGVDAVTFLVTTDGSAAAEFAAESDADVDFILVGHWSKPPGTYTELAGSHWQASTTGWEDEALGPYGVPGDAVATVVVANRSTDAESQMGVRAKGSSLDRRLDLQEAESGGGDLATWHVLTDSTFSSTAQSRSETSGSSYRFYPVGYWTLAP